MPSTGADPLHGIPTAGSHVSVQYTSDLHTSKAYVSMSRFISVFAPSDRVTAQQV